MSTLTHAEIRRRILALPGPLQEEAALYYHRLYPPVIRTPRLHRAQGLRVPETTLYDFVTQRHFLVDRQPFDWPKHQYLVPLYQDFVLDPPREGLALVLMKGAQIGASVWAMLGLLFTALKFPGTWSGYFLPDQNMTDIFSGARFKPLIDSNASTKALLGNDGDGENRKRLRNLGTSTILFGYLGGVTSTESAPLLSIFLDEVRRMDLAQMGLAEQRISHSAYPINVKLSTAGYPESDIHYYFLRSDQHFFHTRCQCPGDEGIVLSETWPECIGMRGAEIFYRCPRCDMRIVNPQDGRYRAHAPSKPVRGYHIPQTLSLAPLHTPAKLWERFTNPKEDRGEFYRSGLGRPYVDPESQLVTEADLKACVTPDVQWEKNGTHCAMGIDQRSAWNDVVILAPGRGQKLRLVHVERIESTDPFGNDMAARGTRGRLDELMHDYDVTCCVSDLNPNYTEAMKFSQRYVPRAFLVTYSSSERADMIAWRDRVRKKDQQPNEEEVKFKWIVTLQRYKMLDYALGLFRQRQIELPHPRGLTQTIRDDHGILRPVFMGEELFWPHMQRIVRQKHVMDEAQGTYRMEMVKVGADPHLAFSFTYAVAAASRLPGGRVVVL